MATSVKEALDSMPQEAKQRLIYALNAEISLVETDGKGRFVGVHVNGSNPHINIESTAGNWCCGTMRKHSK